MANLGRELLSPLQPILGNPLAPNKGGGPWLATKSALRAYLAANDGSVNPFALAAMASPPTIRTQAYPPSGADADLTVSYRYSAGAGVFRYEGGGDKPFAGGAFRRFPSDTYAATSGNVSDGENSEFWRTRVRVTSSKVAFYVLGSTLKYRFIVDGAYVDKAGTLTSTSTGHQIITLDFGASATRDIVVESEQGTGFAGVFVAAGSTVSLPGASPFRMITLGDSVTAGTGGTVAGDGFVAVTGAYLALDDRWPSGVGGTGYVNKGSGSAYYSLPERVVADVTRFKTYGSTDIIVVAAGLNDIGLAGIQAAAAASFDLIRANAPRALVFVLGPWDTAAPSAPIANYGTCKSAIQAAMAGRGGFWFLDPQGQSFPKSDGTHPTSAGHLALGQWLASQIRSAIAA